MGKKTSCKSDSLLDASSTWRYVLYEANSTGLVRENATWTEINISYRRAISRSSVAWTAANIVLYIGHSEAWL